jgi:DNA polymerase-3 subunit alpha
VFALKSILKELHIRLPYEKLDSEGKKELLEILARYPGEIEVCLHLPNKKILVLDEKLDVGSKLNLKKKLIQMYGQNNVWFN